MPYYRSIENGISAKMPQAEQYYEKCISLPMYPALSEEEQAFVIEQVLKCTK